MNESLLTLPMVATKVCLSRKSIYDRIRNNEFPCPRKLGRASRWVESEINDWIRKLPMGGPSQLADTI
ncbi:AlpA family transcriptional regulator [Pseudomonas sp. OV546]|uniref:helix-turn-helix transcriptional regulator n=1 Tax=Pseudomonas sp. OV546 TaxID=1881063 RepID=UPI0008E76FC7|nr:AlpA family phage regulatory protein [Pseudomonas sp. OV546]SFU66733.1 transcriptional regulator, AlpA family [Pseudomonas sp. OV546]